MRGAKPLGALRAFQREFFRNRQFGEETFSRLAASSVRLQHALLRDLSFGRTRLSATRFRSDGVICTTQKYRIALALLAKRLLGQPRNWRLMQEESEMCWRRKGKSNQRS